MTARRELAPAVVVGVVAALLSTAACYALLRAVQAAFFPEPNPALVVTPGQIAMFWRLGVGVYVGGMVGLGAAWAARRDLARTSRVVAAAIWAVAALATVQAVVLP